MDFCFILAGSPLPRHSQLNSDCILWLAFCEQWFPCPFSFQSCLGLPHSGATLGGVYVVAWLQQSRGCLSLGLFCTCIICGWGHGLCWVVHGSGGSLSPYLSFSGFPPQSPPPTDLSSSLLWLERWVFSRGFGSSEGGQPGSGPREKKENTKQKQIFSLCSRAHRVPFPGSLAKQRGISLEVFVFFIHCAVSWPRLP